MELFRCVVWTVKLKLHIDNKMKTGKHCEEGTLGTFFRLMFSSNAKKIRFVSLLFFLTMLPLSTSLSTVFDSVKLINENSTFLHPLMNVTQNSTSSTEHVDPPSIDSLPWWCHCSNDLEDNENESECHCEGPKLQKIPQTLPQVTRLSIANAKFKILREAGLRKYSSTLRDL